MGGTIEVKFLCMGEYGYDTLYAPSRNKISSQN